MMYLFIDNSGYVSYSSAVTGKHYDAADDGLIQIIKVDLSGNSAAVWSPETVVWVPLQRLDKWGVT